MIELVCRGIEWCPEHGLPFLVLDVPSLSRYLSVAIASHDADVLGAPQPSGANRGRVHGLVNTVLEALGARLTAVDLAIAPGGHLRATLRIAGEQRETLLPAQFADGVILAQRAGVPLRIEAGDLERRPVVAPAAPSRPVEPPASFREVIAGLDLDGFGPGDRAAHDR